MENICQINNTFSTSEEIEIISEFTKEFNIESDIYLDIDFIYDGCSFIGQGENPKIYFNVNEIEKMNYLNAKNISIIFNSTASISIRLSNLVLNNSPIFSSSRIYNLLTDKINTDYESIKTISDKTPISISSYGYFKDETEKISIIEIYENMIKIISDDYSNTISKERSETIIIIETPRGLNKPILFKLMSEFEPTDIIVEIMFSNQNGSKVLYDDTWTNQEQLNEFIEFTFANSDKSIFEYYNSNNETISQQYTSEPIPTSENSNNSKHKAIIAISILIPIIAIIILAIIILCYRRIQNNSGKNNFSNDPSLFINII